jgi:hypothetical protein
MEKYAVQQRSKTVELYFRNFCSVVLTQTTYLRNFKSRTAPTDADIRRPIATFREEGAAVDAILP